MKNHLCCYFMRSLVLMEVSFLLSLPQGLRVERIEPQGDLLAIAVVSERPSSCCPLCAQASSLVHSQYQRTLRDVPCGGRKVVLHLSVRKFFCRTPDCARKIFTERLPTFVEPWAQVTTRLFEAVQAIGLATSGELGTRLADRIGFHTSPTTMLGRIMALAPYSSPPIACLGIDDWSFRRGHKFGTILVDLTTHTIIDLLADRSTETSAAWMRKHPEIEVVSRDRGEEYAAAARLGAPQARQVSDRFHLVKNLSEIVETVLARCLTEIRRVSRPGNPPDESHSPELALLSLEQWRPRPERSAEQASLAYQTERYERYQQVLALRAQRLTSKQIARQLGMKERTVRHWLQQGGISPQAKCYRKRKSRFDPYAPYVLERWKQGERNGLQLHREIAAQGYKGSARTIYRYLDALQQQRANPDDIALAPFPQLTSRDAVWLFLRAPADLKKTEQDDVTTLCQASETAQTLYHLVQDFLHMVHHREGERLDEWLERVRASHIPELQRLVRSMQKDKAAVQAGLTLSYSNGIVEGKVNKLKLIKRMGYGRAGFPLLRQRVLHAL
jgi:transposase